MSKFDKSFVIILILIVFLAIFIKLISPIRIPVGLSFMPSEEEMIAEEKYEQEKLRINNLPDSEFFAYYDHILDSVKFLAKKEFKKTNFNHPDKKTYVKDFTLIENGIINLFSRDSNCNDVKVRKTISSFIHEYGCYDSEHNKSIEIEFRKDLKESFKVKYLIYSKNKRFIFIHGFADIKRFIRGENIIMLAEKKNNKINIYPLFESIRPPLSERYNKNKEFNYYQAVSEILPNVDENLNFNDNYFSIVKVNGKRYYKFKVSYIYGFDSPELKYFIEVN